MQLLFTHPQPEAVAFHRLLKPDGVDAICIAGIHHPTGAVFVAAADAGNRATSDRAIEAFESTVGGAS